MESSINKRLVSSYAMVQFFLKQLFKENLIDTDTYVFALNMAKEECEQKQKNIDVKQRMRTAPLILKIAYAYTL